MSVRITKSLNHTPTSVINGTMVNVAQHDIVLYRFPATLI